jgi:uncharacterized protein (DUF488 family)
MPGKTITVYTIGFAKKDAATFFGMLEEAGVRRVIDVRRRNTSHLAGFAKRDDLQFFLRRILDTDYVYVPELAPTESLLDDYLKKRIDWSTYEARFLEVITSQRIETVVTREQLADACLLCSEASPEQCHRRLVAEYLEQKWGCVRIVHLQ